jgi:hypothetical protein
VLSPEQSDRVDEILEDLSALLSELSALMRADPPEVIQLRERLDRRRQRRDWDDFLGGHPELGEPQG